MENVLQPNQEQIQPQIEKFQLPNSTGVLVMGIISIGGWLLSFIQVLDYFILLI